MDRSYGFVRVATATPVVHVGNPEANIAEMVNLFELVDRGPGVQVVVCPELCITGYTCGDLFHQDLLLERAMAALGEFVDQTARQHFVSVVGMPIRVDDQLFNCAVVCCRGEVVAVVPKTYLPGDGEFYELRWFAPASALRSTTIRLFGRDVPIGADVLVDVCGIPGLRIGVEICEDLWMPTPPSSHLALHGATLIVCPSASTAAIGKADYRRQLVRQQSARCLAGYIYVGSGYGESTADVVFDGHAIIAEAGEILGESKRFCYRPQLMVREVDIERLRRERVMTRSFGQSVARDQATCRIAASPELRTCHPKAGQFRRTYARHPFIPDDVATRGERCAEVFVTQTMGLAHRLSVVGCRTVAIGVSGGLDSALALLVTVNAFDTFEWDRQGIHAFSMPGFGTTERTRGNARRLCEALGVSFREVPIVEAANAVLVAEGHEPPCRTCLKCENAQARARTAILMAHGFVVGTGDLSEIALGWCTFGGDQLSMYNPNAGVPKTLVRHVVACSLDSRLFPDAVNVVLRDILETPVSPELIPPGAQGEIVQRTEDLIGPYELHDFFLYYTLRHGFRPAKVCFLAERAFEGTYDRATILKWLRVFYQRFGSSAQFKRDASPNGPKVGSVALSPRGDWRMPSDVNLTIWLDEVEALAGQLTVSGA
ncbi:MAG: NAD(+) synthase [Candidatus Uhrbacteria bacterium]